MLIVISSLFIFFCRHQVREFNNKLIIVQINLISNVKMYDYILLLFMKN